MGGNSAAFNFTDGLTTNTNGIFTALAAGSYIVTISEQANPMCSSVCTVEITEPSPLTCATNLVSDVSCNGLSDGSATVVAAGGTVPYVYAWDNGETAPTATLLNAGTHAVTVTDANGCVTTCSVVITEPTCESLGGEIFFDDNQNGCHDGSEALVFDPVTVTLYECGATPGSETLVAVTTIIDGSYFFGQGSTELGSDVCLKPGTNYFVGFDIPNALGESLDGHVFTTNAGACAVSDTSSDVDPDTGESTCHDAEGDDDDMHIDAGIFPSFVDLVLTKQLAAGQSTLVEPGDQVVYDLIVTNLTPTLADNITLQDIIPNGVSFDPALNPAWTMANGIATTTLSVSAGNLPFGGLGLNQSVTATIILTVNHNVPPGTDMNNVASITMGDDNPGNDSDSETVTTLITDAGITKTLSPGQATPVQPGSQVTYDITVTNNGTSHISTVYLTDVYPETYLTLNDPAWFAGTAPGSAIHTATVNLDPGDSYVVSITFDLSMYTPGMTIVNDVWITDIFDVDNDPMVDSVPDNDSDDEIISVDNTITYDMSLTKSVSANTPAPQFFSNTIEFEVEVCNDGNAPVSNFVISDMLSSGFSFLSTHAGNAGWIDLGGGLFERNIPSIPVNSCVTLRMFATIINNGGPWVNEAEILSATTPNGTPISSMLDASGFENNFDFVSIEPTNPAGAIGSCVFKDMNGNGIRDAGEPGIPGVRVELFDGAGSIEAITLTDVNGNFIFMNLFAGSYYLNFVTTEGFEFTTANQGNNDNNDSDVDGSNGPGTTAIINLGLNEVDMSIYAGLFRCIPLGDLIWLDANGNNQQDSFENGINGVRVDIFRMENGQASRFASTYSGHKPGTESDDGYWKICLPPGQYYAKFNVPQATPAIPMIGGVENDSNVTGAFGPNTTSLFSLLSCEELCSVDAGYQLSRSVDFSHSSEEAPVADLKLTVEGSTGQNHNEIEWTATGESMDNVSQFVILRMVNGQALGEIARILPSNSGDYVYEDYDILPEGEYNYEIRPISMEGEILESQSVVLLNTRAPKLSVYPNPTIDVANVEVELAHKAESVSVLLYDLNGRLIDNRAILDFEVEPGAKKYELFLSGLEPGSYILNVNVDGHRMTEKIIVLH